MSDWLLAGIALLALFFYALIERRAVNRRSRDAWERATRETRVQRAAELASVKRLEAGKIEPTQEERAAS